MTNGSIKNIEGKSESSLKTIFGWVVGGGILAAIITGFFTLMQAKIISIPFLEVPVYSIEKPFVSSQVPIVIVAGNDAAQHKEQLNIKFDGFEFHKAGIPHPDKNTFQWDFHLSNNNVSEALL